MLNTSRDSSDSDFSFEKKDSPASQLVQNSSDSEQGTPLRNSSATAFFDTPKRSSSSSSSSASPAASTYPRLQRRALGPPVRRSLEELRASVDPNTDSEVIMVSVMKVKQDSVSQFEECIQAVAHEAHEVTGLDCLAVVRPSHGSNVYTSVIKHQSRNKLMDFFSQPEESRLSKLLALRDSFLVEPIGYQMDHGSAVMIDPTDGSSHIMSANPSIHGVDSPASSSSAKTKNARPQVGITSVGSQLPGGLLIESTFVHPREGGHGHKLFKSRYQRNNKKGGHKNLRCFPDCRNGVHFGSGFCGDSVKVQISITDPSLGKDGASSSSGGVKVPSLVTIARLFPVEPTTITDDIIKSSGPVVKVGNTLSESEVNELKRDKDRPQNPWIDGAMKTSFNTTQTTKALSFEFNGDCKAWHYGWSAPRGQGQHGQDIYHRFEVLVFQQEGKTLTCVHILRSDAFSIYSSRRASFQHNKSRLLAAAAAAAEDSSSTSSPVMPPAKRHRPDAQMPTMGGFSSGRPSGVDDPHLWADVYSMLHHATPTYQYTRQQQLNAGHHQYPTSQMMHQPYLTPYLMSPAAGSHSNHPQQQQQHPQAHHHHHPHDMMLQPLHPMHGQQQPHHPPAYGRDQLHPTSRHQ